MDLILARAQWTKDGIFGQIQNWFTCEHAYLAPDGVSWMAKIPMGEFNCVRGIHQLSGAAQPFETFEITGVPGHTGLLFHPGNTEMDSSGCVLLGMAFGELTGVPAVLNSKIAFDQFMNLQAGKDSFLLTVTG